MGFLCGQAHLLDRKAIDGGDDVPRLDSSQCRRPARFHRLHQDGSILLGAAGDPHRSGGRYSDGLGGVGVLLGVHAADLAAGQLDLNLAGVCGAVEAEDHRGEVVGHQAADGGPIVPGLCHLDLIVFLLEGG